MSPLFIGSLKLCNAMKIKDIVLSIGMIASLLLMWQCVYVDSYFFFLWLAVGAYCANKVFDGRR